MTTRTDAPRYAYTEKTAAAFINEATGLLADYPEIVASYHVQQSPEEGVTGLAFILSTTHGQSVPVMLRPHVEGMRTRLEEVGRSDLADARTVGWAQVRHLLELQLEAVASGAARAEEVFGGAALTSGNRTVGEAMDAGEVDFMPGDRPLLQGARE